MPQKKTIQIELDAKEALQRLDAVEKELSDINKTAKKTEKGTAALATGFRGIGLAWKAIGIGAVISALQFLADKFSANQEIMDKVNMASAVFGDVLNQIGTVVVSVIKSLGLLGKAVGKVLKGEFKEAGDLAKDSMTGLKDAVVGNSTSLKDFVKNAKDSAIESANFAQKLIDLRNEVKLAEAQQRLLQMTFQKEAEIQRQIRDDVSLTIEERMAANEKLGEILDAQFAEEKALADKKLELAELELSRNETNIDLQVALTNAKTELADLDERITGQRSEQLVNLTALQKEYNDAVKEFGTLKAVEVKEIEINADTADGIMKKALKGYKKLKKQEVEVDKLTNEDKLHMTANSMGQIAGLVGKDSKAGKALAISQALINTYLGATKAIGQGGILGVIAAAQVIASGMATVNKIRNTKLPDLPNADGGGSRGGSAPSLPNIEMPDEEGAGGIGGLIPNLGNIEGATEPQPIQAYVVENEISNSQALQEELELQATL